MKRLLVKLKNRVISRVFAYLGFGLAISAFTAYVLTTIPEYREFLYVFDAENKMMLSVGGWVMLILPLMMFLAIPQNFRNISTGAVFIIYVLFCSLIGAALSGVCVVYVKIDIARSLFVCAGMFVVMSLFRMLCRKDMLSWTCILLTGFFGVVISFADFFLFSTKITGLTAHVAAVVVFCALLAYSETEIRRITDSGSLRTTNKIAIRCALAIFLNLVGLVLKTIQFWNRKQDLK